MDLKGKVAVVTGGASGIGEAPVRTMARLGAKVVIADVDDQRSEALAAERTAGGAKIKRPGLAARAPKHLGWVSP